MAAFDPRAWSAEHAAFFDSMSADEVAAVIENWRYAAAKSTVVGSAEVEVAGAFARHFTARGTGVSSNFALVLTTDETIACKFDPTRAWHPLEVRLDQFGPVEARWPRGAVHVTEVERGRLAYGVRFEPDGSKPIPTRTPRLVRNPASAAVIAALGGTLPG